MKIIRLILMTALITASAALSAAGNPFFAKRYGTPHETLPFHKVKIEHFMPAFDEAFKRHNAEIEAIVGNKSAPDFQNTIEALEYSGQLLNDVSAVFYTLTGTENNDELMALNSEVAVKRTEHFSRISMNEKLFERVQSVYNQREALGLNVEQTKLLEDTYESFERSGASLKGAERERYKELSVALSKRTVDFGQNALRSTNAFEKVFVSKDDLKGMPEDALEAARKRAKDKNVDGWLIDLSAPSYVSFMKYVENRELREQLYRAYNTRAMEGAFDNRPVIKDIVNYRREMSVLLGSANYAEHALKKRMAENSENVYHFLDQLRDAYLPVAQQEVAAIQGFAAGYEGRYFSLEPWDWSYYSEKMKKAQFDVSDEMLRPYFKLENVIDGVFGLATELYGIRFEKNAKIPTWNEEVEGWDVFDADGSFLAVLYTDFHPRKGKRAGAWMSAVNSQYRLNGKDIRPQISITMNFTRSTENKPSLLTYDEVTTFLHEFGHALHGMFSDVTYRSLAGTSVYRDFVELPSQVMENWASEKEFLDKFAVHYETGAPIPAELIEKIKAAQNFNVAYACMRQLSFGYLDMGWHTLEADFDGDLLEFERNAWSKAIVLPQPEDCFMSSGFSHLFAGGYAAGYYSYKWAEALDADAYAWMVRTRVFDAETANDFRKHILSKGGTEHPMVLYKRFRGQEPGIEALLKRDGIKMN
ncbi:MAG: M3 family metallopeptidase [Bacteroidales bacterium]